MNSDFSGVFPYVFFMMHFVKTSKLNGGTQNRAGGDHGPRPPSSHQFEFSQQPG